MQTKHSKNLNLRYLKNRIIRAAIFCFLGTVFILNIINHQNLMGFIGVLLFTISFYFIFRSEKLINAVETKRYRFSFLRQVFVFESFIYSNLPRKIKNLSVHCSILLVVFGFSLFTKEIYYIVESVMLLFLLSFILD